MNADQLLATLARRNEQLKQAGDHMAQLQARLQQQQQQAEVQLAAAHSRQQATESRAAKQQYESMKQVIQLEVGRGVEQCMLGFQHEHQAHRIHCRQTCMLHAQVCVLAGFGDVWPDPAASTQLLVAAVLHKLLHHQ